MATVRAERRTDAIATRVLSRFENRTHHKEFDGISLERLFHRIGQQCRIALAIGKQRMSQEPMQLFSLERRPI